MTAWICATWSKIDKKELPIFLLTSEYAEMFPELDSELPAFRSTFVRPLLPSLKSQCLRIKGYLFTYL